MTRRLFIMRHAKSSWRDSSLTDHARPLNSRGRKTAQGMGQLLRQRDLVPDVVLHSTATRTTQTWEHMRPHLPEVHDVRACGQLYLAGADAIRDALVQLPPATRTVLILGHNPGWERAVATFSGEILALKTGDLSILTAPPAPWIDLTSRTGMWSHLETLLGRNALAFQEEHLAGSG